MSVKLIECPRDAMQGLSVFIPTAQKINYLNQLLKIGFDTIDFGSFVSPKAIPQMKDTAEVLNGLELSGTSSKLLAIVANMRGVEEACQHEPISYLGFPLSLSETFQQRNTNKSIEEAFSTVAEMQNACIKHRKTAVVYLSMGFGNPYGDPYDMDYVIEFTNKLHQMGIKIVSLADTVGSADETSIQTLFSILIPQFPTIEFGAHLHSNKQQAEAKITIAYRAGCRRFDSAIRGFGGCPMAKDDLVGNLPTEIVLSTLEGLKVGMKYDKEAFQKAYQLSEVVFLHS